ncbi:hypothetical protein C4901_01360 [Acidiferrobacter sp. SPIII_3]|jgi:ElaB/YqjD/DUF883 family membrane-anchored ribosome-binding protein|uniref:hypothetical protein n=1 Tax=Acidiferrobacter sp. SPIII_3 TaxID=1281578 RepID=UPI000D72C285|nr:hypothetical protein [Acidiferrobacter sp. SPIII_3]AWP22167.1 hypothetical protein C4901_01360 [Acidiferrobacter sp. SPIII_3]
MDDEVVEVYSSEEARLEAERHRRDLADTLDALSERVGSAVEQIERQVTFPIRWSLKHPLLAVGLSVGAGVLLGHRLQRSRPKRTSALARELEGAYLQGRHDEAAQRPPRGPEYWAGLKLADGPEVGGLLLEAAKPLLHHLTQGIVESLNNGAREPRA